MQKIELQLAEIVEFAFETKNKEKIEQDFFIYDSYVKSMQRYNLEYNENLYKSIKLKYEETCE